MQHSSLQPHILGAGVILDHGDGSYGASYVVKTAGEAQLLVGLGGGQSQRMFTARCHPADVAPASCEVEHGSVQVTAGSVGQLRFRTAVWCDGPAPLPPPPPSQHA